MSTANKITAGELVWRSNRRTFLSYMGAALMIRKAETLAMTVLLVAAYCTPALGQAPPPTILEIDTENAVEYFNDIASQSDPSKIGTNPGVTPVGGLPAFSRLSGLADIVAVNGQRVKGVLANWETLLGASPALNPGRPITDIRMDGMRAQNFQILRSDGTVVGTIMTLGLSQGGNPPPGAPLAQTGQNYAIVGGTGAFLGARGQQGQESTPQTVNFRQASMVEDPANRRINGGGRVRYILHVIPMSAPQIAATANGPAVTHSSDFSLVTASKPAAAGEILSLFVTDLGPTVPAVDIGQPFPAGPPAVVNPPVDVKVNGKPAEVLAAVGFPGAVGGYQVNFRIPSDAAKGTATVRVSAAWIAGPAVNITIQ